MSPLLCRSFSVVSLPFVHSVAHQRHHRPPSTQADTVLHHHEFFIIISFLAGEQSYVTVLGSTPILSDSCSPLGVSHGGEGPCVNLTVAPDSRTNIIASQRELDRYCILTPSRPPPRPLTLTDTSPTTDVRKRHHWNQHFVSSSHNKVLDDSVRYGRSVLSSHGRTG